MAPSTGVLDGKRFTALAEELRRQPAAGRIVDQLKSVEAELRRLRGENYGYNEIWRICQKAGLECSYAHFVKAVRTVLESRVTPLHQARSRSKVRAARVPVVPASLAQPPVEKSGDPKGSGASPRVTGDARSKLLGSSALEMEAARVNRR